MGVSVHINNVLLESILNDEREKPRSSVYLQADSDLPEWNLDGRSFCVIKTE